MEALVQAHNAGGSATDPVCGMAVDAATTQHRHTHHGHAYAFCSAGCRGKFAADPKKYLGETAVAPAAPPPEGAIYTCPMHPEVRRVGPGACPICGWRSSPKRAAPMTAANAPT